jgi:hypothetical protein
LTASAHILSDNSSLNGILEREMSEKYNINLLNELDQHKNN